MVIYFQREEILRDECQQYKHFEIALNSEGDKISIGAATYDFSFGGANVSVESGNARVTLQNISQVALEQIASTSITGDAVTLNFKDGGSLQVNFDCYVEGFFSWQNFLRKR